jgi:O-antigen biosynthesis protein
VTSTDRTERFVPGSGDAQTALEHVLRYEFATELCRGKVVLDLACGDGYGSALMARTAERVTGIDIDDETVESARAHYARLANVDFRTGDAHSIDIPDASIDLVVAFEMIEHVTDPAQVLSEISRVLRSDGIMIISTPNAPENPDNLPGANPFHLHAFDNESLDALLAGHFEYRGYLGQRIVAAGALWTESPAAGPPTSGDLDPLGVRDALARQRPTYLVAVASNDKPVEFDAGVRWTLDDADGLIAERIQFWKEARKAYERERVAARQLEEKTNQYAGLEQTQREAGRAAIDAQSEVARLRSEVARLRSALELATSEAERSGQEAEYFRVEAISLREAFDSVVHSASWKVTKPLRQLRGSDRPEG